jgi:hypothetical protein
LHGIVTECRQSLQDVGIISRLQTPLSPRAVLPQPKAPVFVEAHQKPQKLGTGRVAHRWLMSAPWAKDRWGITANLLSFQQHSRPQRVTTCVFYNIPALSRAAEIRPFIFIDIHASLVHFQRISFFSLFRGGTYLPP